MKRWSVLLMALVLGVSPLAAGEADKPGEKPAASKAPDRAAAEEKAAMEAWAKFATPGPEHKWLEKLAGTWTVKVKSWMAPGQPPTESDGAAEARMMLGGRYLHEQFKSSFMGQPFEGAGVTGYDNLKKKFVGNWMDTMSTAIMATEGTVDAAGKVMTSWGMVDDPVTGRPQKMKGVLTLVDPDHHTYEMWSTGPDGKEWKSLELAYTRKK